MAKNNSNKKDSSLKEENKNLDGFFNNKRFYISIGLIVVGIVTAFYIFGKMKREYVG